MHWATDGSEDDEMHRGAISTTCRSGRQEARFGEGTLAGTMRLRSAAVPGRSKVEAAKALGFSGRIGATTWWAGRQMDQSFMKTIALRCLLVAAPEDGRTPSASFRLRSMLDSIE